MTQQEGIGWYAQARPGPLFALLCLRRAGDSSPDELANVLTKLWEIYDQLAQGISGDLPGEPDYAGGLQRLVGFGPRLFDQAPGIDHPDAPAAELRECMFGPAAAGGPVLPGAALRFADMLTDNGADADVVVQLTANSQAALTRAVVATQRQVAGDGGATLSGVWFGYRREDRRSWLGFHDGVDNVNGPERINVVEVGPQADDQWLRGGTYLAFLRIEIDLDVWENLSRKEQELAVGRDKHTGGALSPAGDEVSPVALATGTTSVFARANLPTREPGLVDLDDPTGLGGSHVQRTRRHPNLRIFRQGYEYLAVTGSPPVLQTGLNFVSFQSSPGRVIGMLRSPSWLGTDSFAGSPQAAFPQIPNLLRVHAAGMFAVPPASDDGPPGLTMLRGLKRPG